MNETIILLLAAVMPAIVLVTYIWVKDRFQHEPWKWIMKGVGYGIISAGIALVLEMVLGWLGVPNDPQTVLGACVKGFVGAAMPEELAKLVMLVLLLKQNPYYDERFDGIVYAVCIGMGFAGTENIIYLLSNLNDWQHVAIQRAIFAVPGHFLFAVAMGYFYSLVYFGDISALKAGRIFWVPVMLHGVYDSLLFMAGLNAATSSGLILIFYYFCWKMLKRGRAKIEDQLRRDEEDPNQIGYYADENENDNEDE